MGAKDIWYGILEAGEKTSPVVRDATLEASQNKVYLYNYVRNQIIEYSQAIVEPKLRELAADDISRDELNQAYKAARQAFTSTRKIRTWADTPPPAPRVIDESDENNEDIDTEDDDPDMFFDDEE